LGLSGRCIRPSGAKTPAAIGSAILVQRAAQAFCRTARRRPDEVATLMPGADVLRGPLFP
jgi:hypothetical protein